MKWINIHFPDFIKVKIVGTEERDYIMQKKKMGSVWGKYFLTKKPIKWLKSPLWEEVEASSRQIFKTRLDKAFISTGAEEMDKITY